MKRRIITLSLVVLLLLSLLAGCGASNGYGSMAKDEEYSNAQTMGSADGLYESGQNTESVTPANQKLIRTLRISAETENLDELLAKVEQRLAELGGYVQNREVYNGNNSYRRSRYANMTVRIPADRLDQFTDHVQQESNVVSCNESTEDVTLSYVATQSRVAALETEQARLLELLAMAENMEDLLLIESKLTDTRAELEQVTSQLKLYDNLVSYGTIHLNVTEVKEYTEVAEEPDGFFERIGEGFMESLSGLWNGIKEVTIFLIVNLPYFVVLGVIITVIILCVKASKKKNQPAKNSDS